MSSMRNAVHRRQHRERGQLKGREKWGILEKHKVSRLRVYSNWSFHVDTQSRKLILGTLTGLYPSCTRL
jgi:Utp11 protein